MSPDARKYGYFALLAGSIGFGIVVTNRLVPDIGWFMAVLVGACAAEGSFVAIDFVIALFA